MVKMSSAFAGELKKADVRHLFGIPSIHNIGFYDALRGEPAMEHVLCRHESSATHMADGYARGGAGPGVVVTSTGPGAAYMIPPLMEAWWSSSPVFALSTNIAAGRIGKKTGVLHEIENQSSMFAPVTKEQFCPRGAEEVLPMTRDALRLMREGRPGPVFFEVPTDLWDRDCDERETADNERGVNEQCEGDLDGAAVILARAERPLIVAGTGALRAGIGTAVKYLAEVLGAPVVTNAEAKGVIPEDHELAFGNAARRGVVRDMIRSATAVLAVGTRLRNVDYARRGVTMPRLVHADFDDTFMDRNFPAEIRLTGSLRAITDGLLERVGQARGEKSWSAEFRRRLDEERRAIAGERDEPAFVDAIRRALPRDSSLVIDNTMLGYWSEYFYDSYREGGLVTAKGSSIIGFGFPAAIGLKLARPERPVAAVTGDGGFFYGAQELSTCIRHGVGFPLVVVNDGAFGIIDYLQRLIYGQGHETSLINPDLRSFAASFGVPADRVHTPDELEHALASSLATGRMHLIELEASFPESPFVRY